MGRKIEVGDVAPEFSLHSQTGGVVDLHEMIGKNEIVLYFYPKDNTPGCTAEAHAFGDRYEIFKEMGAEVVGISSDSVDSHKDFAAKCDVPFIILSDPGGKVRKLFGVPSSLGILPGRVTYVIDRKGIVRHVFSSQMNPARHVDEAMHVLQSIREEASKAASASD